MSNASRRHSGLALIVGAVALALSAAGCTPARMAVPPELAGVAEMPASGRQSWDSATPLRFGPYQAVERRRGLTTSESWGLLVYRSTRAHQGYSFVLERDGKRRLAARCLNGVAAKDLNIRGLLGGGGRLDIELSSAILLTCAFEPGGAGRDWYLVMRQGTGGAVLNGLLTNGAETIRVNGSQDLAGTSIDLTDPTGYGFRRGGELVAAVEVINAGSLRLRPIEPVSTRDGIAAAAAALMLYRNIRP